MRRRTLLAYNLGSCFSSSLGVYTGRNSISQLLCTWVNVSHKSFSLQHSFNVFKTYLSFIEFENIEGFIRIFRFDTHMVSLLLDVASCHWGVSAHFSVVKIFFILHWKLRPLKDKAIMVDQNARHYLPSDSTQKKNFNCTIVKA